MNPLALLHALPLYPRALSRTLARVQGYDVVKKLEAVGSTSGTTSKEAVIADCGVLAA